MSILLEGLVKLYGGHPVVHNVSLKIADGEFFVLLGSSGSGKTTVLNMIAGLVGVDAGRILLHGRDVTWLPTQERRVGMVFQHYALFQHMSVADNVEFGLRVHRVPAHERRRRRDELLELVGLTGLGGRMPRQLSGGQQQRVALARALATKPDVLLLDEPLGALDAKIRVELRRSLKAIQRELGVTTVLVTHDQSEAFELADRLGVMSYGRLLEVGPPQELYRSPDTEFVAAFLGTANLLLGRRTVEGAQVGDVVLPVDTESGRIEVGQRIQVLIRPEHVALARDPAGLGCVALARAHVEQCTFGGAHERIRLRLPPPPGVRAIEPPLAFGRGAVIVEASREPGEGDALPLAPGDRVWVGVRRVHALAHPGMSFAVIVDGGTCCEAAVALGGEMARLVHARTLLLGVAGSGVDVGPLLQAARERVGSGLAGLDSSPMQGPVADAVRTMANDHPVDLVIAGANGSDAVTLAQEVLQHGDHHLMIVPGPGRTPSRALVCVAAGEPGKADVLFAGRLLRHLGARATILHVQHGSDEPAESRERAERFLAAGARTLETLGVPAATSIATGPVVGAIAAQMGSAGHDLLVVGAPLRQLDRRIAMGNVVGQLIRQANWPILIVRSDEPGG